MQEQYGILTDFVAVVGALTAATLAIGRAWRGREKWEPAEQDVPAGAEKVGNLACAVLIVLLWVKYGSGVKEPLPTWLPVTLVLVCIAALLAYSWVISAKVFEVPVVSGDGKVEKTRIIGGFRLTPQAQETVTAEGVTVEDFLKGVAYRPDRVWPRESRSTAKVMFVALSLTLTISGTLALTTAALALGQAGPPPAAVAPTESPS